MVDEAEIAVRVRAVARTTLTPVVRRALGDMAAEIAAWRCAQLGGGYTAPGCLWRFAGTARTGADEVPWSVVLKVVHPTVGAAAPTDWNYWKREALVYGSGLLDDLAGGLAAPRCFGVADQPDGAVFLWLEDIVEDPDSHWSLDRYSVAARHLGGFNGAYLTHKPAPTHPWLSRGQLRGWLARFAPGIAELPARPEDPLIRRYWPGDTAQRVLRFWDERDALLAAHDRLPRTFCHHDAFRRNLFARRGGDGRDETVAIDWAFAGTGAVGEELTYLVMSSVLFFAVDAGRLGELDRAASEGYLAGLRAAGWSDDARLARLGYALSCALFCAAHTFGMTAPDEARRAQRERVFGRPYEQIADCVAQLRRFALDRADEARQLIPLLVPQV
jgi:hypothetical protein